MSQKPRGVAKPNADQYPALYNQAGEVYQLKKLSHRHHAIMDFMLANPQLPMHAIAEHFGVTQAWLSTVRHSDLFKARLAERRQLMDQDQAHRIGSKLQTLAEKGIDALCDIVDDEEQTADAKLNATKTALEAIGFLGKGAQQASGAQSQQPAVQVTINNDAFQQARETAMGGHKAHVIEMKKD